MDLPVTLKEAILGGKVPVPTLTGSVTLTVPPHSNSGRTLRLKGKGMPGAGGIPGRSLCAPDRTLPSLRSQTRCFCQSWDNDYDHGRNSK
jgi:DnaJ-class molecular chaperone